MGDRSPGGDDTTLDRVEVTELRQSEAGAWRITRDIWNSVVPDDE